MENRVRLLCLVSLLTVGVACRGPGDERETSASTSEASDESDGGDTNRVHGGEVGRVGGTTEVLSMEISGSESSSESGEHIVMVWIGDFDCPPDPSREPTYVTRGTVALPWRPGVSTILDEAALEDGEFTVYVLVITPRGDGCFCIREACTVVRAPEEGEVVRFPITLGAVGDGFDTSLLRSARTRLASSGPILLVVESRED